MSPAQHKEIAPPRSAGAMPLTPPPRSAGAMPLTPPPRSAGAMPLTPPPRSAGAMPLTPPPRSAGATPSTPPRSAGATPLMAWAGLLLYATTCAAQAQDPRLPARVIVSSQACSAAHYDPAALFSLLKLELSTLGVESVADTALSQTAATDADGAADAIIAIECGEEADAVTLRIRDAASHKETLRRLNIADTNVELRPRALALAAVELLESSWSELLSANADASRDGALPEALRQRLRARLVTRLGITPAAPRVTTAAALTRDRAPVLPAAPDALRFDLAAMTRSFPARRTALLGLGLGYAPWSSSGVRFALEGELLWGQSDLSDALGTLGTLDLLWLTAGARLGFRSEALPALELGPRLSLGYGTSFTHAERAGVSARNRRHAVASALIAAELRTALGHALNAFVGVDFGYTLIGIVFLGDQTQLAGMAGITAALRAGLSW